MRRFINIFKLACHEGSRSLSASRGHNRNNSTSSQKKTINKDNSIKFGKHRDLSESPTRDMKSNREINLMKKETRDTMTKNLRDEIEQLKLLIENERVILFY